MPGTRFRAVVFDLYETLITEFDPEWQPEGTAAQRLGIEAETLDQVWRHHSRARMTRALDYRDFLHEVCGSAGRDMDVSIENTIADLYSERLTAKAIPLLQVDQQVVESLRQLRAGGLRLGLVSNCSVEEVAAWDRSPLSPLFDHVVFSYQVGHTKPDPVIYLMTSQRLEVLPRHIMFVGDGGNEELRGAEEAGMNPYCARWFLDRWPAWRGHRDNENTSGFPQLLSLAELVSIAAEDG